MRNLMKLCSNFTYFVDYLTANAKVTRAANFDLVGGALLAPPCADFINYIYMLGRIWFVHSRCTGYWKHWEYVQWMLPSAWEIGNRVQPGKKELLGKLWRAF
jgi:hypothetical protein